MRRIARQAEFLQTVRITRHASRDAHARVTRFRVARQLRRQQFSE